MKEKRKVSLTTMILRVMLTGVVCFRFIEILPLGDGFTDIPISLLTGIMAFLLASWFAYSLSELIKEIVIMFRSGENES